MVLVIAGDLDFDATAQLIRQYYGNWSQGYAAPQVPVEPPQRAPRRRTVEYRGRTLPILSINYKAPAWSATDKQAVAVEVLGEVAFGPNSDIYKKLVITERKVQFLSGNFGLSRDPGLASITAMVIDPTGVAAVERDIQQAVDRFKTELVDEARLGDTKRNLKYSFLMGLETAQNVAFAMIPYVINTGGIEAVDAYYRTLDSITPEDLRSAARTYLIDNAKTVVTMVQAGGN